MTDERYRPGLYDGLGLVDVTRTRRIPRRKSAKAEERCPDCNDSTYYVGGVCAGCGYCDHCERSG